MIFYYMLAHFMTIKFRPVEGHVRGERPHRAPKTASPVVRPRRAAASPSAVKLVVEQNPPLSWRLLALVSCFVCRAPLVAVALSCSSSGAHSPRTLHAAAAHLHSAPSPPYEGLHLHFAHGPPISGDGPDKISAYLLNHRVLIIINCLK